jgi:peptidyl-prolyl cis-trans isomerase A (cyclophilin A)
MMQIRIAAIALSLFVTPVAAQTVVSSTSQNAPAPFGTVHVTLQTSLGAIILELDKQRAPTTVANFLRYVDQKRFDGIAFYRASHVPDSPHLGFLQGGTGNDTKRILPPIAHEPTSKTGLTHSDGAISMARLAPGSARGDFIIALGSQTYLDANPNAPGDNLGNAVFGHVVQGMEIVRKIHAGTTSANAGAGVMKGEMLSPTVKILSARRVK